MKQWLLIVGFAIFMIVLLATMAFQMNAYYNWSCDRYRDNPLTGLGNAPARCIR